MCGTDIILGIIAVIFPPLAVWVKKGICSADSIINIALCMLGVLPGILHAWYIIAITPDPTYEPVEDEERGNVTYYYVQGQPEYVQGGRPAHGSQAYGTINSTPNTQFPGQQNGFVQPAPPSAGPAAGQPGASGGDIPPTYQEALRGDHKVQGP